MNEKHYDNLCEIAKRMGVEFANLNTMVAVYDFLGSDPRGCEDSLRCIAALYNALDVLCIALDREDEVQDLAEQMTAENLASKV